MRAIQYIRCKSSDNDVGLCEGFFADRTKPTDRSSDKPVRLILPMSVLFYYGIILLAEIIQYNF